MKHLYYYGPENDPETSDPSDGVDMEDFGESDISTAGIAWWPED